MQVLLLLALIATAFTQSCTQWRADFTQTTSATGVGNNRGQMSFDWDNSRFKITFGSSWSEVYEYNAARGYTQDPGDLQTRSSIGGSCNPVCSINRITSVMPPMSTTLSSFHTSGTAKDELGCTIYTPSQKVSDQIISSFSSLNGKVCKMTFKDGRTFVFDQSTFQCTSVSITKPSGCVCNSKMDIWINVDHSSSISDASMAQFKSFVQTFLNQLTIGPNDINVGMSYFNYNVGVQFNITGNKANINAGMGQWWTNCTQLSPPFSHFSCQKDGTATATSIQGYKGTTSGASSFWPGNVVDATGAMDYFYNPAYGGSVRNVPKMFITLTDGAMNMLRTQTNGIGGCRFAACNPDLTAAMNALQATHNSYFPSQTLTTIAMGIGTECIQNPPVYCVGSCTPTCNDINLQADHLRTLAQGDDSRWFKTTSFSNIASQLDRLVLLACPVTNDVVQETCQRTCCGLCVCGQCKPPTFCEDKNLCNDWTLQACCNQVSAPLATVCPTADKCTIATCDPNVSPVITGQLAGRCSYRPVDCSSFTQGCTTYDCNPGTGRCTTLNQSACPPRDCTWGEWTAWTGCPVSCGNGTITRSRTQNQTALNGGAACTGPSSESQPCVRPCCPVNCVQTRWTSWGPTCPGFYQCGPSSSQTRTRSTTTVDSCGGAACGEVSETRQCPPCPNIDCVGSNTSTRCDCILNTSVVTYTITTVQSGTGRDCPHADKTKWTISCTDRAHCPVDCVDGWSSWTDCDCRYYTQNRSYTITQRPLNGGRACLYSSNRTSSQSCTPTPQQNCLTQLPVCVSTADCQDGDACTAEECLLQSDGLKHCVNYNLPTVCASNLCYSRNVCDKRLGCVPTLESIWRACTQHTRCNVGTCDPAGNNGAGSCSYTFNDCAATNNQSTDCQRWACDTGSGSCTISNRSLCPKVDCVWGEWSNYSSCSRSCGTGTQTRVRTILVQAKDGGAQCTGGSSSSQNCNTQCCQQNCTPGSWTAWSSCTQCDNTTVTRSRSGSTPSCGGLTCTDLGIELTQNKTCDCLPVNCEGRNVSSSCNCTADGFGGYRIITYEVTKPKVSTGTDCPHVDGTTWQVDCTAAQLNNCPKACNQTLTNWSFCDCFDNIQTQMYIIYSQPSGNPLGQACDYPKSFNSTQACVPEVPCPNAGPKCDTPFECSDENRCTVDRCIPVENSTSLHCNWNMAINCTSNNTCLNGTCSAGDACVYTPILPEDACPPANLCEVSICDQVAGRCANQPVNCSFKTVGCQQWDCNVSSGTCDISNRSTCPPIPCTYDEWSDWTSCSKTCEAGSQSRTRVINQTAQDGGAECTGNTSETRTCNDVCCVVNCQLSDWTAWNTSSCNRCNASNQTRTRTILVQGSCNGTICTPADLIDTSLPCVLVPPVDCVGGNISGPCNCSFNGTYGTRPQTYVVTVAKVCAGASCPQPDGDVRIEECPPDQIALCPKPCKDRFTNWSKCDCFNSTQWKEYIIDELPQNGGPECTFQTPQILFQACVVPDGSEECPNLGPTCVNHTDCNDNLACTVDRCVVFVPPAESNAPNTYHCDWSENLVCNDSSICTNDTCDQNVGCVFETILFCDDLNACTNDFCDPVLGCTHSEVVCPDYDDCNLGFCDPVTGCGFQQLLCNTTSNDTCLSTYCDANWTLRTQPPTSEKAKKDKKNKDKDQEEEQTGPCTTVNVCSLGALIGGLTAGIIAAIIVAAILGAALCSGGAVAAANAAGAAPGAGIRNNPLYQDAGTEANNPLFGHV